MRESHFLLPVHTSEALELPIAVERATQRPHAVNVTIQRTDGATKNHKPDESADNYISTRHLPLQHSLTAIEIFQVSDVKKERQVNAFYISDGRTLRAARQPRPRVPSTGSLLAVCTANLAIFFNSQKSRAVSKINNVRSGRAMPGYV